MVRLSSTAEAIAAVSRARKVSACAYTLHGNLPRALEAAALRGARVSVVLEGSPYGAAGSDIARRNRSLAATLSRDGAGVRLAHPMHLKMIEADGAIYVDSHNFNAGDLVLRCDRVVKDKRGALALEAKAVAGASRRDRVLIETETFGSGNPMYRALDRLGLAGAKPRLLVNERTLRANRRERTLLAHLQRDGVEVRSGRATDKMAVAGGRAWIGSANASYTPGESVPDWGVRTANPRVVTVARARAEAQWKEAKPLR